MPTIRQRIADLLFRDERKRLTQANDIILDAYLRGPARYHPDDLLRDLKELDSHTLSNLVRDLDYIRLDALSEPTDEDRVRAVMESRYLFRTSPMIEYAIGLWTSFGFGESVDVIPEDESAVKVWNEFWHADRNASVLGDRRLQLLSDQVLRDGERFLALYVSKADGRVTVRSIDSLEITERITAPGDEGTAVWYKREWTEATPSNPSGVRRVLYYPDYRVLAGAATDEDSGEVELGKRNGRGGKRTLEWLGWDATGQKVTATALLPERAERADQVNPGTYCCILPICHNAKDSWRGWPLMTTGHAWAREHEQFRVNRANVAESTAMFVRELKADTGSRGIAAMKAQMESTLASDPSAWDRNPPPVSGSTFLSNKAVDLRQLSQATGAGDAKEDGQALAWYSLLSARLFPHYAGMGDAYRLATATSMETPILRTFSGYQKFWASVWTDLSRVVLAAATVFDGQTFKTYNADVNLDRLIETDLPQLSSVMAEFYSGVFGPLQQGGMIPDESIPPIVARTVQMYLTELGLDDVEEIITEETIKAAMEEKKRAGEEAQAQAAQAATQMAQQQPPQGDEESDGQIETIGSEVVESAGGNGHIGVTEQIQMLAMLEAAERVLSRDGLAGAGAFGVTDAAPVAAYMQEDGADDGE